jgi:hypothetical protein
MDGEEDKREGRKGIGILERDMNLPLPRVRIGFNQNG